MEHADLALGPYHYVSKYLISTPFSTLIPWCSFGRVHIQHWCFSNCPPTHFTYVTQNHGFDHPSLRKLCMYRERTCLLCVGAYVEGWVKLIIWVERSNLTFNNTRWDVEKTQTTHLAELTWICRNRVGDVMERGKERCHLWQVQWGMGRKQTPLPYE